MSSPTPPAYVLAAPASETSPTTWALRVYSVGTGTKVPLAAAVAEADGETVIEDLDRVARRLGWQRGNTVSSAACPTSFYAWDAWPLPAPAVPVWADGAEDAVWEPAAAGTCVLQVTHKRVVGSVDGVEVAVARTDSVEAGVVSLGEVRVAVTDRGDGLSPDGADILSGYMLEAARLAVRLGSTDARGPRPVATAM